MTPEKKQKIRRQLVHSAITTIMRDCNKHEKQLSSICDNATYLELCEIGNELCDKLKEHLDS